MKTNYFTVAFSAILAVFFSGTTFGQGIQITEIDLTNNIVEITNDGTGDVDISNWWLCNRVNGSPFYDQVTGAATINSASVEASGGAADLILAAGDVLVLDVSAGFLPDNGGEFAFYNTASFGSASAIEDYVAYGLDGIRDSVADAAGIWNTSEFIDLSGLDAGETIQLSSGENGDDSSDYFFSSATLGAVSVPEPSTAILIGLGVVGLGLRRKRMQ